MHPSALAQSVTNAHYQIFLSAARGWRKCPTAEYLTAARYLVVL